MNHVWMEQKVRDRTYQPVCVWEGGGEYFCSSGTYLIVGWATSPDLTGLLRLLITASRL